MKTTVEYPIDDKCQVNNHQDQVGVVYRASGNLFVAKQVCKTVPKSFHSSRSAVTGFSNGSAVRMRRYLRGCRPDYRYMVTLTYPCGFESDGAIVKNQLRRFMQEVQREFIRRSTNIKASIDAPKQRLSLFWFLEFQSRGAPHFHILATHWICKDWVAKRWYDIVNSEDIRHFHAGTRCEKLQCGRAGTVKYAIKYANKQEQKVVPEGYENVGRFWGVYGDRWVVSADTFVNRLVAKEPNHFGVLKNLERCVKKLISRGDMVIIKRETGVLVGIVKDKGYMAILMMRIGAVAYSTSIKFDYFCDAEIDEPDINHANEVL